MYFPHGTGAVVQTVQVDRGYFACMLGGADKPTLEDQTIRDR